MATKTFTLYFDVKDPDQFWDMVEELNIPKSVSNKYLQFGEYASFELVVDAEFNIISGTFHEISPENRT